MDYYFIGEAELLTAFRFVGIEGTAVNDAKEALEAFKRVTQGSRDIGGAVVPDAQAAQGIRVLILTEEVADALGNELSLWQLGGQYPLVVEVPGLQGHFPGRKTLVDSIREAIGIRI